jgi:hypothetical protein
MRDCFKGGTYYRTITIINSEGENVSLELGATGDIQPWVTFHTTENMTSPRDYTNISQPISLITVSDKITLLVAFTIPEYIANGPYNGSVYARTIPSDDIENITGGILILRLPIQVLLSVTGEQILQANVTKITIHNNEVGQPLLIEIDFTNTGNVAVKPITNVNITRKEYPIDNFRYTSTFVDADTSTILRLEWNTTNRESGDYIAHVTVTLGDTIITTNHIYAFSTRNINTKR